MLSDELTFGAGAQLQKLLWASTAQKVRTIARLSYVEELIGSGTVRRGSGSP